MPRNYKKVNRTTHLYDLGKELKTVLHFHSNITNPKNLLSKKVKFVKDEAFFQSSGILYHFQQFSIKRWSKKKVGLIPINDGHYYSKIEIEGKESIAIFNFMPRNCQVIIDIYKGYYPENYRILKKFLENIPYY